MLVSEMFPVRCKGNKTGRVTMWRGIKNDAESSWEAAGYLARNTACLISCSAFRNSLFTTQACGAGRETRQTRQDRVGLTHYLARCEKNVNGSIMHFYVMNNKEKKKTLEACRRTSTTTLTGSPGLISFIASIHQRYA